MPLSAGDPIYSNKQNLRLQQALILLVRDYTSKLITMMYWSTELRKGSTAICH